MSVSFYPKGACIAAVGQTTAAMKAQRALLSHHISAEVVSLSPARTRRGCAYGVAFPCAEFAAVRRALREESIPVSEYISGGAT